MSQSAKDQIIQQLTKLPLARKVGHNIFIRCPFPEHQDRTPSFSVYVGRVGANTLPLGTGFCWGCGQSGDWKKVAKLLKLDPTLNGAIHAELVSGTVKEALLPKKLTMPLLLGDLMCEGVLPIETENWRGIPKKLLKDVGCFYTDRVIKELGIKKRMLLLPCYVNGKLVGGLTARLRKIDNMNTYINSPGRWVLSKGYFCFDYSHENFESTMPIILTEGSRDTLSWVRDGYPATAILGSKVFSKEKARILVNLRRPIIPFMDGDKAGIEAHNLICETLKEVMGDRYKMWVFPYRLVKRAQKLLEIDRPTEVYEMGLDPANLTPELKTDFIRHYNKVWDRFKQDE